MKKIKLIAVSLGLALLSAMTFVGVAHAQTFRTGPSATVPANQTVDSMLFASGNSVDIAGTVNGDVYCAGQTVTISGTIHGDVFCAGQTVTVSGTVDGSVRLAGQTVNLGGSVSGSATVAAQSFVTQGGSTIGVDLLGGTQNSTLNGTIQRDMLAGATTLTINGQVGRNLEGGIETLNVGSTGKVGGEVNYTSQNQPNIAPGGQITGTVTVNAPKQQREPRSYAVVRFTVFGFLYVIVAMLVAALVLVLLFPSVFHEASSRALKAPGRTTLIGFIAVFGAPVVILVLLISLIGTPLGVLALLMWLVVVLLSGPMSGYMLGRLILQNNKSPLLIMLVGGGILVTLYFIPIVGFLVMLAAYVFGVGMFLGEAMRRVPKPSQKVA
jgi:cytoskeletal protein CcmA (bactofilin family)